MTVKGKILMNRIIKAGISIAVAITMLVTPMSVKAAPTEIAQPCLGIDVSRFQGTIDWGVLSQSGISFAMIRIGSRTASTGVVQEDEYARYNLQEANKYGVKVGAYFYSTAITSDEAIAEANFVCDILDKYQITYPVAYDCENYNKKTSRQYLLNKAQRTSLAINFMDTVAKRGYTPMFYGNKSALSNGKDWDMNCISPKYKVWVAWYPKEPFPITPACDYTGVYGMWQYSDKMLLPGIDGFVDINVGLFNYTEIAAAKDSSGATPVTVPNNTQYTKVQEVVTATTSVNIRTSPDTTISTNILSKLEPGVPVWRVGLGNNGWSKILIGDQVFYVSTSYLMKIA